MTSVGWSVVLLLTLNALTCGWSHHHQHHRRHHSSSYRSNENVANFDGEESNDALPSRIVEKTRKTLKLEDTKAPFSTRRLEKMLEKAILKIITGDLGTADMMLLKSLNYSLEEVLAIRENELGKRKEEERRREEKLKFDREKVGPKTESLVYASRADLLNSYEKKKDAFYEKSVYDEDLDYEDFNRQAVVDYEKMEVQQPWSDPGISDYVDPVRESKERRSKEDKNSEEEDNASVENVRRSFDRAAEPHVIFKIRYDDSEFDSSSDEKSKMAGKRDRESSKTSKTSKYRSSSYVKENTSTSTGNSFHTSTAATFSSPSSSSFASSVSSSSSSSSNPVIYRLDDFNAAKSDYSPERNRLGTTSSPEVEGTSTKESKNVTSTERPDNVVEDEEDSRNETRDEDSSKVSVKRVSEYEGLEWVEDDVYRVIPSLADTLADYDNMEENEPIDYEDDGAGLLYERNTTTSSAENDTAEYQNDMSDSVKLFVANTNGSTDNQSVSTYQQLAHAHRRDQGQRVIEDIKSRVLALTRRFNVSSNADTVQRERLTAFSPKCQIPRNTDSEAWWDPFSMNLHFQLNLTSGQHVIAAKLRIYKLPQENLTSSSVATSTSLGDEQEEEDEKKIRISVYYYTKSLRKHRVKKRLMDSLVTPLTSKGTHLALDVRQGLRFWRLNPRNPHGNGGNHGLGIQVEDQDGRPLKPALYIQQPSCSNGDVDQKTTTYLHSSSEPVLVTFAS